MGLGYSRIYFKKEPEKNEFKIKIKYVIYTLNLYFNCPFLVSFSVTTEKDLIAKKDRVEMDNSNEYSDSDLSNGDDSALDDSGSEVEGDDIGEEDIEDKVIISVMPVQNVEAYLKRDIVYVAYEYRDYRKENNASIINVYRTKENAYKAIEEIAKKEAKDWNRKFETVENGFQVHDNNDYQVYQVVEQKILD